MPELAYVNGRFSPISEATVSINDRGFLFADGVYEVLVAYGGRPFGLHEHLDRLTRSLAGIELPFDLTEHRIPELIQEGLERAGFDETMVYIQITRGAAPRLLAYPPDLAPTVVLTFRPKPHVSAELRKRGLSVMTVPDIRWPKCSIKSVALLPNSLVKNDAVRRGYDDAVFVAPSGEVREATASNVFAVANGALLTAPRSEAILHGITRGFVLECARRVGIPCEEAYPTVELLDRADEIFLSSTTIDIVGVTKLNDRPVGEGRVGPVTQRLYDQFQVQIREACG